MKATIKLILMSILSILLFTAMSSTVEASSIFYNEVWKNEGMYTPLTPFGSFEWSQDIKSDFINQFDYCSTFMDQSYYRIMDNEEIRIENEDNDSGIDIADHTFRDYSFE